MCLFLQKNKQGNVCSIIILTKYLIIIILKILNGYILKLEENMSYTHIDYFSGPGGICTGLHAAGI